jgi:hypothetical protein
MTPGELQFSINILENDILNAEIQLRLAEAAITNNGLTEARLMEVIKANTEALVNLYESPVVSLIEFRSLKKGLGVVRGDVLKFRAESREALKTRNEMLAGIPKMRRFLVQLQEQLAAYVPPRVVLEFKRDAK